MANRDGPAARAIRIAEHDQQRVLAEISLAQRMAGLSDSDVGRACRMSRWMVARVVAGKRRASVVELAAIGAAVGLDVRTHAYLGGDPIRDAGQQRLLARFRAHINPSIGFRTEVPLPIPGDQRAWDAFLTAATWRAGVEVETVVDDVQALERRLRLKVRDGERDLVVLVVADTRRNRRALASAPSAFADLSRDSRAALRLLRRGESPPGSCLIFI